MKILLLIGLLLLGSCTKKTKFGECVGLANKDEIKKETLVYDYNGWNIFLAFICDLLAAINLSISLMS